MFLANGYFKRIIADGVPDDKLSISKGLRF